MTDAKVTDAKPLSPQNQAHRERQALCAPHSPWMPPGKAI